VVVTVNGLSSGGFTFTVTASITQLSPTSGPVGSEVTITGVNLGASQGANTVQFDGKTAAVKSWSPAAVVAIVPPGATTGDVVVKVNGVTTKGIAFTVTFVDHPLAVTTSVVKAVHIDELRTRINAARASAGLSSQAWTDPNLKAPGVRMKTVHITELRDALNAVYQAKRMGIPAYTEQPKAGVTIIKAAHILELRTAVMAVE
jgi:hypothetical protein